ncbi:hypothetical protein CERSUDRAFT_111060 [Gelatoporia subvermispora B]|uniref:Uncharacterized protein n=1 Tax=Ceriporiopsis subvermispora (strain B) TaxID=914234 RepID=M2R7S7_CERS8|nr:hypothetical protein CERSUDRAFT_111060 [Gelatoporia subvermispora B]
MATIAANHQDTLSSSLPIEQDCGPSKISAYYSLVFPNFTYYLQTLNVTVGRRCIPANAASSSDNPQVDVDLGPLKSVSRLHAKIEYEEDEERFVLLVLGRNGAWVDGVWSGSGSKVPLSDRSQIQIASRTFHFVLPPPPAPEDSPSPSSQSSGPRARSPSVDIVDITSFSPPSSLPSCSPPPTTVHPAPPKAPPLAGSSLPNSNSISKFKTNPKKRRKSETLSQPPPPPEVMPPKPQLTYAQLCYRGIKALGGKASLQDICQWIKETYEWFKYCDKDWESSVRHNLSSNPGFKKLLRSKEEKGKGALWLIEESHEHTFEEQDAKKQQAAALAAAGGKDGKTVGKKGKTVVPLEPPLKRSVKDLKGAPLPPPLTSTPLMLKTSSTLNATQATATFSPFSGPVKLEPATTLIPPAGSLTPSTLPSSTLSSSFSTPAPTSASPAPPAAISPTSTSPFPAIPASVRIPIIVGPVPQNSPEATSNPPKPIVLHENTLILNPDIFSHLSQQQLQELEALGAQKALEILQSYIVRYYKEKLKAEGGRGRGRGRPRRARGGPPSGRGAGLGTPVRVDTPSMGPFTTAPLPPRPARPPSAQPPATGHDANGYASVPPGVPAQAATHEPPMASLWPMPTSALPESAASPIVIVDDDPPEEPASKRRRLDDSGAGAPAG